MLDSFSELVSNGILLQNREERDELSQTARARSRTGAPGHTESLEQIKRILGSPDMYGSDMLCRLLEYLAQHSINSSGEHLKEYQIATEILGRSSDFDPRSDASVRVQVGRLRTKLAKYYSSTGALDPILIDIPKGSYALCFERRTPPRRAASQAPEPLGESAGAVDTATTPGGRPPDRKNRRRVMAALVGCALLGGGFFVGLRHRRVAPPSLVLKKPAEANDAFRIFWSPFLRSSETPFVIFSSAAFVGDAESGLRYFDPARDAQDRVTYHYTGVGEVNDMVQLDRLFLRFNRRFHVKASASFTLDDARDNNLIFVGSPTENTTLRQIPSLHGFIFRRAPDGPGRWNHIIVDLYPRKGDTALYVPTPHSRPLDTDYAVISLAHGLDRNRWTLILGGTSTIGTQAAVDFVCDRDSVEQLLRSMNVKSEADLRPFEALLRVKVANEVPLGNQIVVLRQIGN